MALYAHALLSLAEFKSYVFLTGTEKDSLLEDVINEATDEIERVTGRLIVTRGQITEYHTMRPGESLRTFELRPRQWPIISVTSVHEDTDWPRTYPATSLLTVAEDYEIVRLQRDYLRRLETCWALGTRAIKLVYAGGYADAAAVPGRIKAQAKRYAALLWREIDRQAQGVSSQGDALGNFTRFGPARITPEISAALMDESRVERFETAEAA